ncbi:MAG: ATP-binding protein [Spirochaetia bacterium]
MPFAGELISVREEAKEWEGAFERVLRNFGLSLLVPADLYAQVADWVDRTHLRGRLVYYRVGESPRGELPEVDAGSMVHRLVVRPDHDLSPWVERELRHRFDYLCADTMEEFRRASRAITRSGQIKGGRSRHEKDDRHRIDDRSRYILGWRNDEKIRELTARRNAKEAEIAEYGTQISRIQDTLGSLQKQRDLLYQLRAFEHFDEINWRPHARRVQEIDAEIAELERDSDVLARLRRQLDELESRIREEEQAVADLTSEIARYDDRRDQAEQLRQESEELISGHEESLEELSAAIEPLRHEALGEHRLTVESCDNRQQDLRDWIQRKLDAEAKRIEALRERILTIMHDFHRDYPAETSEIDVSIEAGDEYRAILERLRGDDLPKFESRFKSLLNENTIREIANFQAQLNKECELIRERVDRINHSMSAIEFNRDRYIRLEVMNTTDSEIRSFRGELKSCTEGSFTGSRDEQYTEEKFLQVKAIIDRFKGREGTTDSDRRWTEKVTDVRNWFTFAASERWKSDDSEHEHYTDSGGKSGGQKEKLAYTVLAASLAYQFGLEFGEIRSRSFRFVVIDEAFGKGSDESTRYGLDLFSRLNLQLLIVTPLQKIHIIEPYVSTVGFVHTEDGKYSLLRNMSIEEYREERDARHAAAGTKESMIGADSEAPDEEASIG